MRSSFVGAIALTATLLFTGCATSSGTATPAVTQGKPSQGVQKLINKYNLEVVDYTYARSKLGNGMRSGAKAIFIDARPEAKYKARTIPSSINIPDTKFKDFVGQLDKTPKDAEILVYCGGWECGKSPKVAGMLQEMGFTNVKLYQAGEPEWVKIDYAEIGTSVVKAAFDKNSALLIDARPYPKFIGETIPGAIAIPDTEDCQQIKLLQSSLFVQAMSATNLMQ
jgi:rhodanese-related sulfurtransferase